MTKETIQKTYETVCSSILIDTVTCDTFRELLYTAYEVGILDVKLCTDAEILLKLMKLAETLHGTIPRKFQV